MGEEGSKEGRRRMRRKSGLHTNSNNPTLKGGEIEKIVSTIRRDDFRKYEREIQGRGIQGGRQNEKDGCGR